MPQTQNGKATKDAASSEKSGIPEEGVAMAGETVQIKRYPNRRFYARNTSKYVSLQEIEEMIRQGHTVEIRDSRTGESMTRAVLAQIILERQPEKMSLFPVDMLHYILRSNDVMGGFLRDYFRHSLTYLDYLQKHGATAKELANPMHWVKAWLGGFGSTKTSEAPPAPTEREIALEDRIEQLEARIRQVETDKS